MEMPFCVEIGVDELVRGDVIAVIYQVCNWYDATRKATGSDEGIEAQEELPVVVQLWKDADVIFKHLLDALPGQNQINLHLF